jgi:type II secretory pathway pseudopilin PulG
MAVTMVIVAIIAAIAIPSYSNYALQAHRTDAKTALLDLASLEERYFSVNNTYTNSPSRSRIYGVSANGGQRLLPGQPTDRDCPDDHRGRDVYSDRDRDRESDEGHFMYLVSGDLRGRANVVRYHQQFVLALTGS